MAFAFLVVIMAVKSHENRGVADFQEIALEKPKTSLNTSLNWVVDCPFPQHKKGNPINYNLEESAKLCGAPISFPKQSSKGG